MKLYVSSLHHKLEWDDYETNQDHEKDDVGSWLLDPDEQHEAAWMRGCRAQRNICTNMRTNLVKRERASKLRYMDAGVYTA